MDKYEYKVRSEEITKLIDKEKYAEAVKIADTIDWRRVKSVAMLLRIAALYRVSRRNDDSREMLMLAYDRYPTNRSVVHSLCELSIEMDDVVSAIEYYKQFAKLAPKDSGVYTLRYRILEAQEASLEERIEILEELKKRDYQEEWAYELAYLYHRVGFSTKCVEECDDIILWFGDGPYVMKAMELKAMHVPLTNIQQKNYDIMLGNATENYSSESYDYGSDDSNDKIVSFNARNNSAGNYIENNYDPQDYSAEGYDENFSVQDFTGNGYANEEYAQESYTEGQYAENGYEQPEYGNEQYADNRYGQDEYADAQYPNNAYGQGGYGDAQYTDHDYGQGEYANTSYTDNSEYGQNEYANTSYAGNSEYGQNEYANTSYAGNSEYGQNEYGDEQYANNNSYGQNGYANEQYVDNDSGYGQNEYVNEPYADNRYGQNGYDNTSYPDNSYGQPTYKDESYTDNHYGQNEYVNEQYPKNAYGQTTDDGYGQADYTNEQYIDNSYEQGQYVDDGYGNMSYTDSTYQDNAAYQDNGYTGAFYVEQIYDENGNLLNPDNDSEQDYAQTEGQTTQPRQYRNGLHLVENKTAASGAPGDMSQYNTINLQKVVAESMKELFPDDDEDVFAEDREKYNSGEDIKSITERNTRVFANITNAQAHRGKMAIHPTVEQNTDGNYDYLTQTGRIAQMVTGVSETAPEPHTGAIKKVYVPGEDARLIKSDSDMNKLRDITEKSVDDEHSWMESNEENVYHEQSIMEMSGTDEATKARTTGPMKIDDVLVEWERRKLDNAKKHQEEIKQHVLSQTGKIFDNFDNSIKSGILGELEREEEAARRSSQADQALRKERAARKQFLEADVTGDIPQRATSDDEFDVEYVTEHTARQEAVMENAESTPVPEKPARAEKSEAELRDAYLDMLERVISRELGKETEDGQKSSGGSGNDLPVNLAQNTDGYAAQTGAESESGEYEPKSTVESAEYAPYVQEEYMESAEYESGVYVQEEGIESTEYAQEGFVDSAEYESIESVQEEDTESDAYVQERDTESETYIQEEKPKSAEYESEMYHYAESAEYESGANAPGEDTKSAEYGTDVYISDSDTEYESECYAESAGYESGEYESEMDSQTAEYESSAYGQEDYAEGTGYESDGFAPEEYVETGEYIEGAEYGTGEYMPENYAESEDYVSDEYDRTQFEAKAGKNDNYTQEIPAAATEYASQEYTQELYAGSSDYIESADSTGTASQKYTQEPYVEQPAGYGKEYSEQKPYEQEPVANTHKKYGRRRDDTDVLRRQQYQYNEKALDPEDAQSIAEMAMEDALKTQEIKMNTADLSSLSEKIVATTKKEAKGAKREELREFTPEEQTLFENFAVTKKIKKQIIHALENMTLTAYTGNVIITGDAGLDTVRMAKNLVKEYQASDESFSGKLAKITGEKINQRNIKDVFEKLNNGGIIIEKANGMSEEKLYEMALNLNQENLGIVVIMEDTKKEITKLLEKQAMIADYFNIRIDLMEMDNNALVAYAKNYALALEYSIDELGTLALYTRIANMQSGNHVVTKDEVRDIIDEAIWKSKKSKIKNFVDVLFARRYDNEDMIVLKERDFM